MRLLNREIKAEVRAWGAGSHPGRTSSCTPRPFLNVAALRPPKHVHKQGGRGLGKGVVKPADEESGIEAAVGGADADGVGPCPSPTAVIAGRAIGDAGSGVGARTRAPARVQEWCV